MEYPSSTTNPMPTGTSGESSTGAGSTAHGYVDRMAQGAHETVDRLANKTAGAGERLRSMKGSLQSQAEGLLEARYEMMESARSYVRQKPFTALLGAMLVGVVLSHLMRGSSRY